MSRITSLGLVLAFAVSACVVNGKADGGSGDDDSTGGGDTGGGDTGGGDTGGGSHGGGGSGNAAPQIGGWNYTGVTLVTNTCNQRINRGEAGNFAIDQVAASSFRIVPNDGTAPFTCTLSRSGFSCPNRASSVQDGRPSVDAVLTVHVTADGTFSDATHGTGRQAGTVDCVGTACSALGTLPCTFTQDFAIRAL
jgi:hypothetical protein